MKVLKLLLSLEGNYVLTQNQVEVITGKNGDVKCGNELECGRRGPSFNMHLALGANARNADHPLDHMSDSLLAKYFISHLVLVLGGWGGERGFGKPKQHGVVLGKTTTSRTTTGLVAETASCYPSLIVTLDGQVAQRYV